MKKSKFLYNDMYEANLSPSFETFINYIKNNFEADDKTHNHLKYLFSSFYPSNFYVPYLMFTLAEIFNSKDRSGFRSLRNRLEINLGKEKEEEIVKEIINKNVNNAIVLLTNAVSEYRLKEIK